MERKLRGHFQKVEKRETENQLQERRERLLELHPISNIKKVSPGKIIIMILNLRSRFLGPQLHG